MARVTILLFFVCIAIAFAGPTNLNEQPKKHHSKARDQDHLNVHGHRRTPREGQPKLGFEDAAYWYSSAQDELTAQLAKTQNTNKAKNIIVFLGDGTSLATMTAIRLYNGRYSNLFEEHVLKWEEFPYTSIIKTYNTDEMTTDSAASATAYLTGSKANQATIGVDINVQEYDCEASKNTAYHTTSVLSDFQNDGRSTGIVTMTRVTHASPAGNYAHTAKRHWESDKDMWDEGGDPTECMDIARQLVYKDPGQNINVILGGGRRVFMPESTEDPESNGEDFGDRQDGLDLIANWQSIQNSKGTAAYVWNKADLLSTDPSTTDYLLGLFDKSHMEFAVKVEPEDLDPTLPEMVEVAIQILEKNSNGFFLFVEGGLIDKAHHEGMAEGALEEGRLFELALQTAMEMTNASETLIIVTADHGQPLTLNGYQARGSDITGLTDSESDEDGMKFNTMMYGNGPGYREQDSDNNRPDPEDEDWSDADFVYPSAAPVVESYHSMEDVILWANGPWAHLFTGIHENSYIPAALRYAACVGTGAHSCTSST